MRRSLALTCLAATLLAPALAGCGHSSSRMGTIIPAPPYTAGPSHANDGNVVRPDPPAGDPWAVPPSVEGRAWRYIVVHHSATDHGSAATIDAAHKARGWQGLGYDFVIDNGNGGPDGRVEVGPRWRQQSVGAHTGGTPGNAYNEHGIGICLIGNFTKRTPSAAQLASLNRLVSYLAAKYSISVGNIIGHRDAPNAHTECPGDLLWSYVHGQLRANVARQVAWR